MIIQKLNIYFKFYITLFYCLKGKFQNKNKIKKDFLIKQIKNPAFISIGQLKNLFNNFLDIWFGKSISTKQYFISF